MRSFRYPLVAATFAVGMAPAFAGYDYNQSGTMSWLKHYTNNDTIIFELSPMPTHSCSKNYFTLSTDYMTPERIKTAYATLLAAKTSGRTITVGYGRTATTDCSGNAVKVYAIETN